MREWTAERIRAQRAIGQDHARAASGLMLTHILLELEGLDELERLTAENERLRDRNQGLESYLHASLAVFEQRQKDREEGDGE